MMTMKAKKVRKTNLLVMPLADETVGERRRQGMNEGVGILQGD